MNIKCQVSESEQELLTILTHVYIHMVILVPAMQILTLEHTVHRPAARGFGMFYP